MMVRRLLACCALALSAPAPLAAQSLEDYDYENLTFRGLGLDLGYVWPNKVTATPAYSLRADLGYLGPGIRIAPSLTYWSSTMRERELDRLAEQLNRLPPLRQRNITMTGSDLGAVDWSDIALSLDAHYVWFTPIGLLTYAGAGAGVHLLNGKGAVIEGTFVEDLLDSLTPGVAAIGGLEYQLAPRLRIYGEARYTLLSDLRYGGLRIGGAFMIPQAGGISVGVLDARRGGGR